MDDDAFAQRLRETQAWCATRADASHVAECLRSSELRPQMAHDREGEAIAELLGQAMKEFSETGQVTVADDATVEAELAKNRVYGNPDLDEDWFAFMVGAGERSWTDMVEGVASLRRQAVTPLESTAPLEGLLLFYEDDASELNGAAASVSDGFLNICDVAPWDTWLTFLTKNDTRRAALLVSWVPPLFEPQVTRARGVVDPACLWTCPATADLALAEAQRERALTEA